jgi:hypothetical protein
MTLDQFIASAHLNVNGGELSPDSNVKIQDVAVYAPHALREAVDILRQERLREAVLRKRTGLPMQSIEPFQSKTTIYRTPEKGVDGRWFLSIPKIEEGGVIIFSEKNPDSQVIFVPSPATIAGISDIRAWAWYEKGEGEAPPKVILHNYTNDAKCRLLVQASFDIGELAGDDVLPVPGEVVPRALDRIVEYFSRQRRTPADNPSDSMDINEPKNMTQNG